MYLVYLESGLAIKHVWFGMVIMRLTIHALLLAHDATHSRILPAEVTGNLPYGIRHQYEMLRAMA